MPPPELPPLTENDIPGEIKATMGTIDRIMFPRQGYTSQVAAIESKNGSFLLNVRANIHIRIG